jgi:pullulanase
VSIVYSDRFSAFLDALNRITILIPLNYRENETPTFTIYFEGQKIGVLKVEEVVRIEHYIKYICTAPFEIPLGEEYQIEDDKGIAFGLRTGAVIRTPEFDEHYHYDGNDLGAVYTKEKTVFKLWAPTATSVKVKLINDFGAEKGTVAMQRGERGVWSLTIHNDLKGYFYSYLVRVNYIWREATDPYSKAVSVNGQYSAIIDPEKIERHSYKIPTLDSQVDAIIYETHVRDFSHHNNSGMDAKGKYLAFTEENTKTNKGYSTGISYLKELGVTHIELLPVNDFSGVDETVIGKEYNWGYNPRHFNSPVGVYSTNPHLPFNRIEELKELIKSLHKNGLGVILDVVYNHVFQKELSNFEKIVPGYYFRYDSNGMPSNGSGCGNDVASERFMVRKFIIASIKYWMEYFQVDGFRFDLMGLLDLDTMKEIERVVREIRPDAILIGEGWDLHTALPAEQKSTIANAHKLTGIGFFNDRFRDTIKGSNFDLKDIGYISGKRVEPHDFFELVTNTGTEYPLTPVQSVNFVECHDNHTLWDRLQVANGLESNELRQRRHRFATSIVLLSQGIPFLHSGQEFFRTKQGIENSYCSPDWINELNWDLREQHDETISYLKCLIQIRKSHGAFRFRTREEIERHMKIVDIHVDCHALMYENVGEYGSWKNILVIFHHAEKETAITLPNDTEWDILCDSCADGQGERIIRKSIRDYTLEPLRTYVFVQE